MATTKEKSLHESIQTTRKRYELLKQQEIKDLKDVLEICCCGEYEFDYEDGELQILGSPVVIEDILPQEKIYTYKLLPGQIQYITEYIFNDYCENLDDLQV